MNMLFSYKSRIFASVQARELCSRKWIVQLLPRMELVSERRSFLPFSLTHVPFQIEKDWYEIAFFSGDLSESYWKFDEDSESEGIL